MDFNKKVYEFIKKESLIVPGEKLILAVSGGSDSVALLHSIYHLKEKLKIKKIIIAHMNHLLRGKESDRDENFVKKLAGFFKLEIEISKLDIKKMALLDINRKESIESVAHKYRMIFLKDVANKYKASKILTAHNKNDLAETILMWLSRGTGILGAKGILPINGNIVRPLLDMSKKEIMDYVKKNKIVFVKDSSNDKLDYTRNAFRHNVLPEIEKVYSGVVNNLSKFSKIIRLDDDYLDNEADKIYKTEIKQVNENTFFLPISIFKIYHKSLLNRIIIKIFNKLVKQNRNALSYYHVNSIYELLEKTGEKEINFPMGIKVKKDSTGFFIGETVKVFKIDTENYEDKILKLQVPGKAVLNDFGLEIDIKLVQNTSSIQAKIKDNKNLMFLNYEKIMLPLYVRKVQQGDKFKPLGAPGTKKLSDYFTDKKIPPSKRWNKLLIEDRKQVLGILEDTIDEKYRVDEKSKILLRIKIDRKN